MNQNTTMKLSLLLSFFIVLISGSASGQINYVLFSEVTFAEGDDILINTNNRGDNPFNSIRGKLFLNSWITENAGYFMKVLADAGASSQYGDKIRVDGAYFLFNVKSYFNIKLGRLPASLGIFPERSYFERTALIGSPLLYHYRTSLPKNKIAETSEILSNRGKFSGLNIIYETCWLDGIEFFTDYSKIDYKLSISRGTYANPTSSSNKGYQITGHLGFRPVMGMRIGLGYSIGPYLNKGAQNIPAGKQVRDYKAIIYAADIEYSFSYFEIYSEWIRENFNEGYGNGNYGSYADEKLVDSYYIESRYKFTPRIYAAFRFGQLFFSKIMDPTTYTKLPWDYNVNRLETGIGYKYTRKMTIKAAVQLNRFIDAPINNITIYALQVKAEL